MNTAQPNSREIADASADYLSDLQAAAPRDGDDLRLAERERGCAEAIRHFARSGLLTPDGLAEARKILAAGGDWLRELEADRDLPPRPEL